MAQLFGHIRQIRQVKLRQRIKRSALTINDRPRFFRFAQKHTAYPVFVVIIRRSETARFKRRAGAGDFLPQLTDFLGNKRAFSAHCPMLPVSMKILFQTACLSCPSCPRRSSLAAFAAQ